VSRPAKISKLDVHFYLDAQRQDGIDRGSQSWRTGQVLALREKLLSLPGGEFDLAMRTLHKMVEGKEDRSQSDRAERKVAAVELYQQSQSLRHGQETSVGKI
jgi:hypothetical protein